MQNDETAHSAIGIGIQKMTAIDLYFLLQDKSGLANVSQCVR